MGGYSLVNGNQFHGCWLHKGLRGFVYAVWKFSTMTIKKVCEKKKWLKEIDYVIVDETERYVELDPVVNFSLWSHIKKKDDTVHEKEGVD